MQPNPQRAGRGLGPVTGAMKPAPMAGCKRFILIAPIGRDFAMAEILSGPLKTP